MSRPAVTWSLVRLVGSRQHFATVALALACVGCVTTTQDVPFWRTSPKCNAQTDFPEKAAAGAVWDPDSRIKGAAFGVAMSGGGSRAAAAAIGQLRALVGLEWQPAPPDSMEGAAYGRPQAPGGDTWIDHVSYISAVSGGAWLSALFTYSPASPRLLLGLTEAPNRPKGRLVPPSALSNADFDEQPGYDNLLARAIEQGTHLDQAIQLHAHYSGARTYGTALGNALLPAVGLSPFREGLALRQFTIAAEFVSQWVPSTLAPTLGDAVTADYRLAWTSGLSASYYFRDAWRLFGGLHFPGSDFLAISLTAGVSASF